MKIVSSKQMAYLESEAYRNGSSEEDFMEEAGKGIASEVHRFITQNDLPKCLYLLCGKGNNAGDAYVAATYLLQEGYSVLAYQISPISQCSALCQKNHNRYLKLGGLVNEINLPDEDIVFDRLGTIIDALFGTGFHGIAKEPYSTVIKKANASKLPIIAIDIPSGLDGETGIVEGEAIHAKKTLFLGLPKKGFFLEDGWNHVGKLHSIDFGLPKEYIEEHKADMILLSQDQMRPLLPKIVNNRHKYQAGYVVGIGGSPGMPGAAIMASIATLRSGAGIVRLLHPKGMDSGLAFCPHEVIREPYDIQDVESVLTFLNQASATFIGPGIGKSKEVENLLKNVFPQLKKPCVIDADALTLIGERKISPPLHAILTPHVGEMYRLLKDSAPQPHSNEFLEICQQYAEEHQVTLILKGGPTFIFHPNETISVNPHGDPGMATAGSGDVLTGVLAALLAQGLPPYHAAMLGTYLHGLAGELAASEKSSYSMIAGDILDQLPNAFILLL